MERMDDMEGLCRRRTERLRVAFVRDKGLASCGGESVEYC